MTPLQLKRVGMAKSWATKNVPEFDDAQYRLILRNIGQVREDDAHNVSTKSLTNTGFESVMSWFESVGWEDPWKGPNYWTLQASRQGGRQEYSVDGLVRRLNISEEYLAGIIRRITRDRTDSVAGCNAYEQGKIIEALKSIAQRSKESGGCKPADSAPPARGLLFDPSGSRIQNPESRMNGHLHDPYVPTERELQQFKEDELPV